MTKLYIKIFILVILFLNPKITYSQEGIFGKNKVQYKEFNWEYIQTEHFDIYYYDKVGYISKFTAQAAESAYASISKKIRFNITNRIPIMIYNSHNDFQQTNVVSEYMEEGVGGVTELFKNRVVVPFEGDYKQYRHVIHHELVHAVLNDMFYGGSIQSVISNNIQLQLPHWFNEGLSEYLALEWDINSDMFMRDATLHTYLPSIENLSGYFSYRAGQSVWYYIATKYGEQKISEILHRIKGLRNIDNGFKSAIGLNVKELNERWQKGLKVAYWPDISKREEPKDFAQQLTHHTKDGNFYNTSPAISPQGDKIAFISDRDDYFDVFVISTIDNKIKKIIDGQRTTNFEELHLLTPGISWSGDGKKIALAVKSGEKDAIIIVDVETGEEQKLPIKSLEGIFSVDWSHSTNKLVFVGNSINQSDIYVYDFDTKILKNLTNDIFSDSDPTWSSNGELIYFSSDRSQFTSARKTISNFNIWEHSYSQKDVYSVELKTLKITQLTNTPFVNETNPIASNNNKTILYVSDKNGIGNIYQLDISTLNEKPITNSITGLYQLSLSKDASKLSFSCLNEAGFDIFLIKNPFERELKITTLEKTDFRKEQIFLTSPSLKSDSVYKISETTIVKYGDAIEIDLRNSGDEITSNEIIKNNNTDSVFQIMGNVDAEGNYKTTKYKLNFSPDIIYATTAFSTYYGMQGTTVMAFSDMLGDHQIYFVTNLLSDLRNSDYSLGYFYLPGKIDYGFQGFHSARYLWLSEGLFRFRNWGFSAMSSYPFDKFNRIDASVTLLNLSRESMEYPPLATQRRELLLPTISYVHDNSLWWILSPNNGRRFNLTFSFSPINNERSLDFQTLTFDYRNYIRLFRTSSFASRLTGGVSTGKNPQSFFIGGTEGWINYTFDNNVIPIENVEDYVFLTPVLPLRGFNYNVMNGSKYFILNNEYRFQLIQLIVTGGVPLALQNIMGTAFVDIGSAWKENNYFKGIGLNENGQTKLKDLLMGMGVGTRFILFGLPFKIDVAWSYDLQNFSKPRYYFSLGGDY